MHLSLWCGRMGASRGDSGKGRLRGKWRRGRRVVKAKLSTAIERGKSIARIALLNNYRERVPKMERFKQEIHRLFFLHRCVAPKSFFPPSPPLEP